MRRYDPAYYVGIPHAVTYDVTTNQGYMSYDTEEEAIEAFNILPEERGATEVTEVVVSDDGEILWEEVIYPL